MSAESYNVLNNRTKVCIIDGNSLLCRAFYGVPANMNSHEGIPTNACYGFVRMLLKFIEKCEPDIIVCAFDGGKPEFRKTLTDGGYKAQRAKGDDTLYRQFPVMEELLSAWGILSVRAPGWEGDDVIGTLTHILSQNGNYSSFIISSDKDMMQLVDESTAVVMPIHGIHDVCLCDIDEVKQRYGLTPSQITDFIGLKGDKSDNIKGVKGIGEKTAIELLVKYKTLEDIADNIDEIPGAVGKRLRDGIQDAFDSRTVATICRNIDLSLSPQWKDYMKKHKLRKDIEVFESTYFPHFDNEEIRKTFSKYDFSQYIINQVINSGNKNNQTYDYDYEENNIIEEDENENSVIEFDGSLF